MAPYSLRDYGWMIEDRVRMEAHIAALRAVVKPGDRVLDIGAGSGVFSLVACTLGAREVVAVDPNPVINVARRTLAANGFGDRVTCVQDLSTEYTPSEPFDVIVSDMRGVLPLFGHHLHSSVDARDRLLVPGGAMIPTLDRLFAAPVEAPAEFERIERPWRRNDFGLDLSAAAPFMNSLALRAHLRPPCLLARAEPWCELDYRTLRDYGVKGDVRWAVTRDGVCHGVALWFDAVLCDGIGFSNAPQDVSGRVYGQLFLPLTTPVVVEAGDTVTAGLTGVHANGTYVWRWSGEVVGRDRRLRTRFDHTDLAAQAYGVPFSYGLST